LLFAVALQKGSKVDRGDGSQDYCRSATRMVAR
jgi:hypothetical protein